MLDDNGDQAVAVATHQATAPVNLLDLSLERWRDWFVDHGEKPFRARQVQQWVFQHGQDRFAEMTDLAKSLRTLLEQQAEVRAPSLESRHVSADGTQKWVFTVDDHNRIETIFIPEVDRGTLCISTQAGCALDCAFCRTGKSGFNRNLSVSEIIGQLWLVNRLLATDDGEATIGKTNRALPRRAVTNVVLMGMGEPLANFDATVASLQWMLDDHAFGLSRRRVTVSTAGVAPRIDDLARECPVSLAVSLHAATDELRDQLVPINRKYPLKTLLAACRRYLHVSPRYRIMFEYVMLAGVNDSLADAAALVALLGDMPCKINIIPFNPYVGSTFQRSQPELIQRFCEVLLRGGLVVTTRKTRGEGVNAACGQLAGQVLDRTRRQHRYQMPVVDPPVASPISGPVRLMARPQRPCN